MRTIYLVDYLGVHCGMHYYLESFKEVLSKKFSIPIEVLSNYSDNGDKAFFLNQYKGSKINKGLSLLQNLWRLKRFVNKHNDDIFIYLTYGNSIDIYFMNIIANAPNHVIDIHEAIAQDVDSNQNLKSKFKLLYRNSIKNVISHSTRTNDFLNEYGFNGIKFEVPHFKYSFPKEYNQKNLSEDIKSAVTKDRINLLFFGNLNESKGVDILLHSFNLLSDENANKFNLIIAGKDFDGAIDRVKIKDNRSVKIFKRHISDDELRFFYNQVDFLCLPYRKTSQSGILEMAFYFKKPIIASDIPYFHQTLTTFPSFGILSGISPEEYSKSLKNILNKSQHHFFNDIDYGKYTNRKEIQDFLNEFNHWVMRLSNDSHS